MSINSESIVMNIPTEEITENRPVVSKPNRANYKLISHNYNSGEIVLETVDENGLVAKGEWIIKPNSLTLTEGGKTVYFYRTSESEYQKREADAGR